MKRVSILAPLLACVFLFGWSEAHAERVVERVRLAVRGGFTRIVVDLDGPSRYQVAGYSDPNRVAINIPGSRAGRALRNLDVGRGGIARVRVNRLSWGVQIVLDLRGQAVWTHFTLAAAGGHHDRIVVDVRPSSESGAVTAGEGGSRRTGRRKVLVAIDPGHGGKDPGTSGKYGLVEKKLVLDIGRRVARELEAMDGVDAVLTRNGDYYLTLERRMQIAEQKGADIFVSIHLNWAPRGRARGAEIYFLSPSGAERTASRMLAHPHRAATELGLHEAATGDLLEMLVDVNQQAVLVRSEALAESIMEAMSSSDLPPTRTVKQKSFVVLRNITMPSVLVEAGFVSNTTDARILRDPDGRDRIARAMARGIASFLRANPPVRDEDPVVHKVRAGETLWKISRRYGTSVASIRKLNRLGNSSVLRVGQELLISGGY